MASYEEILGELYEVLQPLTKEAQTLGEDTELLADLGIDSVKIMEVLLQLEDRFDISIPLNALPDVHTIKDLGLQLEKLIEDAQ